MSEDSTALLWKEDVPEEYRDSTLVQEAKSIGDVVKGALEAQSLLGNAVRIPNENSTVEETDTKNEKLVKQGFIPKEKASEYLRPKEA